MREEVDVASGDGVFESGEGEAAHDAEGYFGSDARDFFYEQLKEVAFFSAFEAVKGLGVFFVNGEGIEKDFVTEGGEHFCSGQGDVNSVADSVDVDNDLKWACFGDFSLD